MPNAPGADSSPNNERFPARRAEKRHAPSEPALPPAVLGPLQSPIGETAGQWFERWIVAKEAMGLRCGESYRSTWREHLAPRFALQPLTSIRRAHVRRMMEDLRGRMGPGLEPATIRNIYTCLRSIMTGAVRAGLISESPCRLDPGELPPKRDGERYQRSTHVFNSAELATILTSPEIELVDRAFYGLLATGWMRPREAVELRWADIDWGAMPLPRIAITRARSGKKIFPTKTGVAREAPVCPLLGDVLRELRDGGWARIVGRAPNRDDLVLARLSAAGAPVYLEKKRQHLRWAEASLGLRPEGRRHVDRPGARRASGRRCSNLARPQDGGRRLLPLLLVGPLRGGHGPLPGALGRSPAVAALGDPMSSYQPHRSVRRRKSPNSTYCVMRPLLGATP